mgnify:FL=1
MYKVAICGHFGGNKKFFDGQTTKTKNLYEVLAEKYGENEIYVIDTYNWRKNPFMLLKKCVTASKKSKNIIILPAHNGVKVFVPLFTRLKKIFNFSLFYDVIGGWLPSFVKDKKGLQKNLKKIDKIFVETNRMQKELQNLGFNNIEKMVNFKSIKPIKENEIKKDFKQPYHICTFSRVMEEKGIEDIIRVVRSINTKEKKVVYELDIYGQVDKNYEEKFKSIQKDMPEYIKYKGCIDSSMSKETLKNYYLLIFPTKFKTEGIPGTIIDAYFSGLPVVATNWENATEIVDNEKTGYIIKMNDLNELEKKLLFCLDNVEVEKMRKKALDKAQEYVSTNAIKTLLDSLK